jgi:flagellar motor switch protein FliM
MSNSFSDGKSGDLGRPGGGFERAPMSYDFKRPQRIDKEGTRLVDGIHEQFSRNISSALASTLRLNTDVDLAFTDQITFSEFTLSLPIPCSAYSFSVEPSGGGAVLSLSPDLVSAVIDRAFGGKGSSLPGDPRQLTQIETKVVNKLANRLLSDLESAWEPVFSISISDVVFESNPDMIRVTDAANQVLTVAFEAHFGRASGLLQLCYPLHTLDPVLDKTSAGRKKKEGSTEPAKPISPTLINLKVPVAIRVARGKLPLEEVAKLTPGDVIKLDTVKGEPAVVFIGDQPKFLGRPGLSGSRRAVEILEEIPASDESLYS